MGSTHVVTCKFFALFFVHAIRTRFLFFRECFFSFEVRAHIAIILILTLTIDAFVPEDSSIGPLKVAGDYSAVFPLLTVAVFVALQISRRVVFYPMQRSRGDINAVPQALCEPGKEGKPLVIDYDGNHHELDEGEYEYDASDSEDVSDPLFRRMTMNIASRDDIEANFQAKMMNIVPPQSTKYSFKMGSKIDSLTSSRMDPSLPFDVQESLSEMGVSKSATDPEKAQKKNSLKSLDDLLNGALSGSNTSSEKWTKGTTHRRTQSEPFCLEESVERIKNTGNDTSGSSTPVRRPLLKRLDSYGEIDQCNPSLMDQVRGRAASVDKRLAR
jgi:hypothetical protein